MAVKHEVGPTHASNYCQSQSLLGLSAQEPLKVPRNSQKTGLSSTCASSRRIRFSSMGSLSHQGREESLIRPATCRSVRKEQLCKGKGTVTNLLKELGWPSLEHRRKYHRLDLFYKTKTGKTALQIPDQLNRPMSRPTRAMDSTCLIRPITKGDNYAQSYFPRTIRDWNNLPRHIRHCTTKNTFKSALFKHFFE